MTKDLDRATDGWRALRRGIVLGLVAVRRRAERVWLLTGESTGNGLSRVGARASRSHQARRRRVPGRRERPPAGLDHGLRRDHGGLGSAAGSRPRPAQPGGDVRQRRSRPHAATARGRTATLTIDAMADQTSALIDTLGLGRPDVLGWSMGGMIAQALAVLHPPQVAPPGTVRHLPRDRDGRALAGGNPGQQPFSS